MGWIIAILVIGLAIAGLVGGAVLHPLLYGLFIASILIVPLSRASCIVYAIIDAIYGQRR